MMAVMAPFKQVEPLLTDGVELAALNAPSSFVVAGPEPSLERFSERCRSDGIAFKRLRTSHAFHSRMMDAAVSPMMEIMSRAPLSKPVLPFVSTVTGKVVDMDMCKPEYWGNQIRLPVRFSDAVAASTEPGPAIWVEVGPGTHLSTLLRMQLESTESIVVPCCQRAEDGEEFGFAQALARVWESGIDVDFASVWPDGRRMSLPGYQFDRERHWIEPPDRAAAVTHLAGAHADQLGVAPDTASVAKLQLDVMEAQLRILSGRKP
jgi:acyl transferase domain-containing protein